ncbi:hypothetical protein PBI_VA6_83 [Mycobacterium phage VA6]|nr:hypothetical protein PBI_VA6_83 [Mycobacterium phage VA6]QJD52732.1 hypothetical protein PBI_AN3_83 [Mycobacterium phage AN3]
MVIQRTLLGSLLLALLAMASIQVGPAPAHAEVSVQCMTHLAEHPGETPGGDRRYHLEHGEFSPCTEADANEGSRPTTTTPRAVVPQQQDDEQDDDHKSRYCRKHWFC